MVQRQPPCAAAGARPTGGVEGGEEGRVQRELGQQRAAHLMAGTHRGLVLAHGRTRAGPGAGERTDGPRLHECGWMAATVEQGHQLSARLALARDGGVGAALALGLLEGQARRPGSEAQLHRRALPPRRPPPPSWLIALGR